MKPIFFNHTIVQPDSYLERAFQLLEEVFDPAVMPPKQMYLDTLTQHTKQSYPWKLICRCWQAETDDSQWGVVGVAQGSCIPLAEVGYPQECIGAIDYLAIAPPYQRQGQGQILVDAVQQAMATLAQEQGWHLRLIVLESKLESVGFWSACGYRTPQNSVYYQPSIVYAATDSLAHDAVLEALMLKLPAATTYIERSLLLAVVRAMYMHWYLPNNLPADTHTQLVQQIEGLYEQFTQSIGQNERIALI